MRLLISAGLFGVKEAVNYALSQGKKPPKNVRQELKPLLQKMDLGKVKVLQSHQTVNPGFFHGVFSGKGVILPKKLPSNANERKFAALQNLVYLKHAQFNPKVSKLIGLVAILAITYFASVAVYGVILPKVLVKVTAVVTSFFMKEAFIHFSTMKKLDKKLEKILEDDVFRAGKSYLQSKLKLQKEYRNEKKIPAIQSYLRAFLFDQKGNYRLNTLGRVSLSDRIKKLK